MSISAKTQYACIAAVELALQYDSGDVMKIGDIADKHGIPSRSLVPILIQLKGAGLVVSTRGAAGGYRLNRSPDDISIGEVMNVFQGDACEFKTSTTRSTAASESLCDVWREAETARQQLLESTSLAKLAEQSRESTDPMYYI